MSPTREIELSGGDVYDGDCGVALKEAAE
jgi:hypothetical protein